MTARTAHFLLAFGGWALAAAAAILAVLVIDDARDYWYAEGRADALDDLAQEAGA